MDKYFWREFYSGYDFYNGIGQMNRNFYFFNLCIYDFVQSKVNGVYNYQGVDQDLYYSWILWDYQEYGDINYFGNKQLIYYFNC